MAGGATHTGQGLIGSLDKNGWQIDPLAQRKFARHYLMYFIVHIVMSHSGQKSQ